MSRRRFAIAPMLVVVAACGGGSPPPAAPPPPPAAIAASPPPAPVDLSPVPMPDGLLLVGRVSNPDGVVKAVGSWAHLPLPGGRELARSITDDVVADTVDLSQPVDGALMLVGSGMRTRPIIAVSVAVKSVDDAKAKLAASHKITPASNGSFRVDGIGQKMKPGKNSRGRRRSGEVEEEEDDELQSCVLAPAPSGGRLVCGDPGALESLVPYLTRTVSREKWSSDIHIELHPEPVREPVQQLRSALPFLLRGLFNASGSALRELADSTLGEVVDFANDTQKIALDAQVADSGLIATTHIEFQKSASLIARMATSRSDKADASPASFFHLPQETDVAFFARGSDPQLFDRPKKLFANVILELTEMGGVPEPERNTMRDLFADRIFSLFSSGPVLYAKGYDAVAIDKAVAAREKVKPNDLAAEDEAERVLGEQIIGWHLLHVAEPIDKVGPILKDISGLWNRPAFAKWMKDAVGGPPRATPPPPPPSSSPAPPPPARAPKDLAKVRIAPPPAGVALPKDTVHLEIAIPRDDLSQVTMPPSPRAQGTAKPPKLIPRKPIVVHIFAVPDGKSGTFLAFGLDGKLVAQKAFASLASSPETNTLSKAPGLEPLREGKWNGVGLVTLRGLLVFTALGRSERSPYAMMGSLPNKAATPILLTFKAEAPSDAAKGGSATSIVRIPRGSIEDVVRLLLQ